MIKKVMQKIMSRKMAAILSVQSTALWAINDFMNRNEVVQLLPVALKTSESPNDAVLEYNGQKLSFAKDMLLHKRIMICSPYLKGVYAITPCVRFEQSNDERHLLEFSQVAVELRNISLEQFMRFTENLFCHVIREIKRKNALELEELQRKLREPKKPFKEIPFDLAKKLGTDFREKLSEKEKQPFWVTNIECGFHDRKDCDLIYPEKFGEALSGGERNYKYASLFGKARKSKQPIQTVQPYLKLAKANQLAPSTGGGIGLERFLCYLTGTKNITEVSPFAKNPGKPVLL
ncbi:MAG: amino acid--tRNA ligase-related protein [Candidatus Diapherotrites archaeon]